MTTPRLLDETIDLTPFCDEPAITTRGIFYAALMAEGHSEFSAFNFARNARAIDGSAQHGVDDVRAFLSDGPRALAA